MLRVLDLFSEGQAPRADSASGQVGRGKSGIAATPYQGWCFCSSARRHYGDAQVCERHQEHDALRTTGMSAARPETGCRNVSDCHLAHAWLLHARNRFPLSRGFVCRTPNGFRAHSAPSIRPSNANDWHRRVSSVGTWCRIGGNGARSTRQPSFAASGISPCNRLNTISPLPDPQQTRTHKIRNVSGVLPCQK